MTLTKALFDISKLPLIAIALYSCGAHGATYDEATERYCELYNPKAWSEVENRDSLQEVYGFIVSEAMKIDNEQFRSDLQKLQSNDFSIFHKNVHSRFESRLGHRWECENFDDFFFPKQKVIEISLGKHVEEHIRPDDPQTLVLMLTAGGDVLVDNKPLSDSSLEAVSKAIEILLERKAGTSTQVYLYMDKGTDGSEVFGILMLLKDKGIETVRLIGSPEN